MDVVSKRKPMQKYQQKKTDVLPTKLVEKLNVSDCTDFTQLQTAYIE